MDNFSIKNWYLWPCEEFPGSVNMQLDHFLAREMSKQLDQPILRFFTWKPYCISLGFHQNLSDIDQKLCELRGIDIVRRPTGGRAILHAEELTYSVIYPFHDLDVADFYRLIHLPFVETLQEWGIPAEFQAAQADFRQIYKTDRAYLCFATSAQHEVEIHGKKLIGSAQRVYNHAILQHGSILLGPAHLQLVDFLQVPEEQKKNIEQYLQHHTDYLWKYNPDLSADSLAEHFSKHFEKYFDLKFQLITENKRLFTLLMGESKHSEFAILEGSKIHHHPSGSLQKR